MRVPGATTSERPRPRPARRGCLSLVWWLAPALLLGLTGAPADAGEGEILIRLRGEPAGSRPAGAGASLAPPLESSRLLAEFRARLPAAAAAALAGAAAEPLLPARRAPAGLAAEARSLAERLARTYLLRLDPGADPESVLAALSGLPAVDLAVLNRAIPVAEMAFAGDAGRAAGGEPDARRAEQWYLDRVGAGVAWAVTRGRAEVLIAAIDTGVSPHADLTANLWRNDDPPGNARPDDDGFDQDGSGVVEDWEKADDDDNGFVDDVAGYDFVDAPRIGGPGDAVGRDPDVSDDSGHGTAVAGVISAVAENGIGIAGLAPGCTLMPVRAGFNPGLGPLSGVLEEDDAAAAIVYAAENGAGVINMSWGDTLLSPVIADAIAYAHALGAVLVGAAGNSNATGTHYPSGLPGVIGVGASTFADGRASFSNYGPALDLLAPGEGILTTVRFGQEDDYLRLSGTSFAAPLVAAAAGLLRAHAPELGPAAVEAILLGTSRDLGWPGYDLQTGNGRLDAGRALSISPSASVAIHVPAGGAGVDRVTPVVVTAEGLRLREFVVEFGAGREPASFSPIVRASGRQVVADTVAMWETATLPPGEYTVRLRAEDTVEGWRETRALVTIDHTPPAFQDASIVPLWVEDRLTPFVFFATDDLARGVVELLPTGGDRRRIDEGFLTRDHVLRIPEDVPPGPLALTVGAINAAGIMGTGPELAITISSARAHTSALIAGAHLPAGDVAPPITDLDGDGAGDLMLMREPTDGASPFGPLAIYEAAGADTWVERRVLAHRLLPRDAGDSDGDGRMEILASGAGTAWLLESPRPVAYPDSVVWADTTAAAGFAIGFAPLGDPAGPSLLAIRGDTLIVYRPTGDAAAWRRTAYANFSGSPRSFVPSFFAGDIDGDGTTELVTGDGGGRLLVFRASAGLLAPVYSFALPAAASPRIAGGDVDGDGRPEVIVDQGVDLEIASEALLERRRHVLLVLAAEPAGLRVTAAIGIAGAESGGNALRAVSIDGDPEAEILLVAAPDLYVFDREPGGEWFPSFYRPGVRSASLALGDADGDGRVEVAARETEIVVFEARDPGAPGPPPVDGLRAHIAADGAIELAWNPGGEWYRIYRAAGPAVDCVPAQLLAQVNEAAYRDTTAASFPVLTYRVSALTGGREGECSLPLTVEYRSAPVLLAVAPEQARVVRVVFSAVMDPSADRLENYTLVDAAESPVPVSAVIAAGGDRVRLLVLARDLVPGASYRLRLGPLRSAAGVPLAGAAEAPFTAPAGLSLLPPLHLESAVAARGGLALRLSAAPDPELGAEPASYELGGGLAVAAASVQGREVTLTLDPATPLHPGVFAVGLAPTLRGAAGEVVVPGQGDRVELVIGGELVAFPNPYRAGSTASTGVTFVGLMAGDELLLIDVAGRELLRVDARNDGTAFVPVLGNAALASGVYIYRVTGPGGTRRGILAITR